MSSNTAWRAFINFIAFIALMFIGVALILTKLNLSGEITNALRTLAEVLAYATVAFCALVYASQKWGKKHIGYMIAWVVAVVLILLAYVIK